MSSDIVKIYAREVFDSRGNPTIEAEVELANGIKSSSIVPSGASVGSKEAFELRDSDEERLLGRGVLNAVKNVNEEIAQAIVGMNPQEQFFIDKAMIQLDGTENKSRLGANAILAVSCAVAKAAAASLNMPLFRYLGGAMVNKIPLPMMNFINGGAHADNNLLFQEFMIVPIKFNGYREAITASAEIYYALKFILKKLGYSINVGDEGGFAPNITSYKEVLDILSNAVEEAGYKLGEDIQFSIDAAASEFYNDGKYKENKTDEDYKLDYVKMTDLYSDLMENYPILSIEDPIAEYDHEGWAYITSELGNRTILIGDDLFVSNPKILLDGVKNRHANAILIKPNQIGTITEMHDAINIANKSGYHTIMSHRSGETEDVSIAHFAVAFGTNMIKTGALCRGERIAKYNELLRIDEVLASSANYNM